MRSIFLLSLLHLQAALAVRAPGAPDTSDLYMNRFLSNAMYDTMKAPVTVDQRFDGDGTMYRTAVELRAQSFNCTGCEGIDACLASGSADDCVAAAPPTALISEFAWIIIPSQNTCGEAAIREAAFGFQLPNPELVDWTVYAQDIYLDLVYLSPHCAGVFLQVRPLREDAARITCMTLGLDGDLVEFTREQSDNSLIIHLKEDIPLGLYNRRWIFTGVDERFMPRESLGDSTTLPRRTGKSGASATTLGETQSPVGETTTSSSSATPAVRRLNDEELELLLSLDPLLFTKPETTTPPWLNPTDNVPEGPMDRSLAPQYAHRYYWSEPFDPECYMMGQFWNNIVIGAKRDRVGTKTSQS